MGRWRWTKQTPAAVWVPFAPTFAKASLISIPMEEYLDVLNTQNIPLLNLFDNFGNPFQIS